MKRKAQSQLEKTTSKKPHNTSAVNESVPQSKIDNVLQQLTEPETKSQTQKKPAQSATVVPAKKKAVDVSVGVEWGGLAFSKPAKPQQPAKQKKPTTTTTAAVASTSTPSAASTSTQSTKKQPVASTSRQIANTVSDEDESTDDNEVAATATATKPTTTAAVNIEPEAESDDKSDSDDGKPSKKQQQVVKKKKAQYKEDAIAQRERELLQEDVLPETSQDFERLLLASPSSSFIWIKFMAFKLAMTDIEGARVVGERALKSISFREEQEKFNVYAALLNIESKFGTQETVDAMFKRALQYCEPKPVWLQMAKIYEQNSDPKNAVETYEKAIKKFRTSRKLWESYELFYITQGDFIKASQILQRSLLSLPQRKQIQAISKFAIMQYKYGKHENGRKIFEGILANHPGRTDIWSMYIDLEMSVHAHEHVRQVYNRVVSLKLSTYKMKSFLQRFLSFEQHHGTPEAQEHVKQIAMDYIAQKTSSVPNS